MRQKRRLLCGSRTHECNVREFKGWEFKLQVKNKQLIINLLTFQKLMRL